MAEAVSDAFAIENVTAIDQFLLELFKFAESKSGTFELMLSIGTPLRLMIVHLVLLADHRGVKQRLS